MENASAAFLDAVRRSMNRIRTAIGATTISPELLTCAEKLRYQGYLQHQDSHAAIAALVSDGVPLKEIVRRTGHSRNLVRQISRGGGTDMCRTRQSILDGHLPFLDAQCSGGCRNGAELWRRLKGQGFKGSLRVVAEWTMRRRRAETISHQQLQKVPAAKDDSAADGAAPPRLARQRRSLPSEDSEKSEHRDLTHEAAVITET